MSFDVVGKLYKTFPTEQKTGSFQAREFVIEIIDGNYNQFIKFQLTQDRCSLIDSFEVGDDVKVYFDLRGREWQDKFFTNLNAWKVESVVQQARQDSDQLPPSNYTHMDHDEGDTRAEDFDDLPF